MHGGRYVDALTPQPNVAAVTAVVLAAGTSSRMGVQKLLLPVRGVPMVDRVLAACAGIETVVVVSPQLEQHLRTSGATAVITNTEPHLGMAHSLALAHDYIARDRAIAVFLADKPLMTAALARRVIDAGQTAYADVCFPERDGIGGHPVYFSARARERIAGLSGDSLRLLRDAPDLRRVVIPITDEGAYFDVDDPGALRTLDE